MSIFPEFEQALRETARGRRATVPAATSGRHRRLRHFSRRSTALAILVVLGTCAIALAASGVILSGTPVRPEELQNPAAGIGVSAPGGASGIVATAPDPEGGPPWGLRIVHTTRGETCLQIGRVQNGQLGVIGIDGAFGNDGRFHPIPANALPRDVYHHTVFDQIANATTSCALEDKALAGEHIGVDRSADPNLHVDESAPAHLRDLQYGLLGPQALSVTYRRQGSARTLEVAKTTGAYLIVYGYSARQPLGYGSESLGTFGDLSPDPPLSLFTYRINGTVCNRGPTVAGGEASHLEKPCPFPHFGHSSFEPPLHLPLQVRLSTRGKLVGGLSVSLVAPFAITSADQHYTLVMPSETCGGDHGVRSGAAQSIARNVTRGELIAWHVAEPSAGGCNRHTLRLEVVYSRGEGLGRTIAATTVDSPPGTSFVAPPTPRGLRHASLTRRRLR